MTTLPARGPTTNELAQRWLQERVDPGAVVLVESYAPWVDPERYDVVASTRLIDGPVPEAEYVIASEAMYGRFLDDPTRYPLQALAYRAAFAGWDEVAAFSGNGPTVRIFRQSRT